MLRLVLQSVFSNQNNINNERFLFFFPYGSEKISNIFTNRTLLNTTFEKITDRILGKEYNFCLIKRWKLCFVSQSPIATSIIITLKIVFWSHLRKICMTTLEISRFLFCFIYCIDSWRSIWSICVMRSEFGLIYRIQISCNRMTLYHVCLEGPLYIHLLWIDKSDLL